MAKTNIGRVSVVPKDEYSSTENYKRLDVVSGDGSMYISKKDNNIGNPLTDENWWFKAVEKGEVGPQGEKPVNGVDYNTPEEKEEFKNDVVNKATKEVEKNIADIEDKAIKNYNDNTTTKLKEYDDNATSKVNEFNINATNKTNSFDENATAKTNAFNSNASSKTDEFNTNYEEKLESINEASTSIEQERVISDGKYPRALKMQVKDEQQTQIYAENDVVHDLMIKGAQLAQKTRDGYNKFNLDTIAGNNYIDGYYENDSYGVLVGSSATNTSDYIEVKAGQSYLLKYDYDTLIDTGNRGFAFFNKNKKVINQGNDTTYKPSNKSIIFTAPNEDGYLRFSYDKNCNNVQLVEGTEEKPYEQYGASPSIDFPSEIKVANEQNIQISKNNIFNMANITSLANCTIDNNILTTSSMNTYSNFKITITSKGLFKGTVYLSFDVRVLSGTTNNLNTARFNDALTNVIKLTTIGSLNISSEWTRVKFKTTLEESYELKNIWVQIANATSAVLEIKNIMISYYDVEYEDYYDITNITIPLTNSAIGQYADTIDRKNNVQNKVIKKLIFTGEENWILVPETNTFYIQDITDYKRTWNKIIGISNYFPVQSSVGSASEVQENHISFYGGGSVGKLARIYIKSSYFDEDLNTFKLWLSEKYKEGNPIILYYVSETIDKIPLSEEIKQKLNKFKLYDDLNNVFIDKGSLSFKYNKSLLRALEEQSELSASLLERIQVLEQAQVNSVGGN